MLIGIIIGVVLLAGCIAAVYIQYGMRRRGREKRTSFLQDYAVRNGFDFAESAEPSFLEPYRDFHLFAAGGGANKTIWVRNMASGMLGGHEASLFDYSFVDTHYGVNIHDRTRDVEHRYTTAMLKLNQASAPLLLVRARGIGSRVSGVEGWSDVGFDDDRAFSKKFRVAGKDASSVQDFLTPGLRKALLEKDPVKTGVLEANGDTLIYYTNLPVTKSLPNFAARAGMAADLLDSRQ